MKLTWDEPGRMCSFCGCEDGLMIEGPSVWQCIDCLNEAIAFAVSKDGVAYHLYRRGKFEAVSGMYAELKGGPPLRFGIGGTADFFAEESMREQVVKAARKGLASEEEE